MAFTYNGSLGTDLDRLRFYLQDTTQNQGPKPGDANFTDAELTGLIAAEGTWQRAVAAGFETLAAAWIRYPTFTADGASLQLQRSDIAKRYQEQARDWRSKYGGPTGGTAGASSGSSRAGSRAVTRVDAYSGDVASDEV